MINENSNLSEEEIDNKLNLLWKEYAKSFNNVGKTSYPDQSKLLANLLDQIRTLEKLK